MKTKKITWLIDSFVDFETKNQFHVPGAQKQSSRMAIIIGTFAAVGGFLYGYDTGLSNNILSMDYVVANFSKNGTAFSSSERAIATASLSLGTMFGSIVSPLLSDIFGRKMAILFAALVVFNIGNICQMASTSSPLLCVGRSITGSAVGVLSAVVPLYQSEASPKWIRGAIVSTYQWAITWGFLCSSAISQGTHHKNNSSSYRIPIGLQSGWAFILSFGMFFLPESPRYHVMKDQISEAAHSLHVLRRVPEDDPGLIEELVDIKATHDYALSLTSFSYMDCFRSGKGRSKQGLRMFTGITLQALQQATGINFIFYYGVWFFVRTGVVKQSYLYSLLTYAVNVISTIPGILLIEIIGRRNSLIYGGCGMTVSSFIIAIAGTAQTNSSVTSKIMLAFVCVFIFFFAATWGPGVWVITSEIFPLGVRGRAVSLSTAANWLFNFGFAFLSPYLIGGDTDSTISLGVKIFFLWGGLSLFATIFSYFAVYETKGLRLEEIDEMYRVCKNARDSPNFVSRLGVGYDPESGEKIRTNITSEVTHYRNYYHNGGRGRGRGHRGGGDSGGTNYKDENGFQNFRNRFSPHRWSTNNNNNYNGDDDGSAGSGAIAGTNLADSTTTSATKTNNATVKKVESVDASYDNDNDDNDNNNNNNKSISNDTNNNGHIETIQNSSSNNTKGNRKYNNHKSDNFHDEEKNIACSSDDSTTLNHTNTNTNHGASNLNIVQPMLSTPEPAHLTNFNSNSNHNNNSYNADRRRGGTLTLSSTLGSRDDSPRYSEFDQSTPPPPPPPPPPQVPQLPAAAAAAAAAAASDQGGSYNENANLGTDALMDLGYGFQLSHFGHTGGGAPSVSTSSSDSSLDIDMNFQGDDLREYVNNLQSRQHNVSGAGTGAAGGFSNFSVPGANFNPNLNQNPTPVTQLHSEPNNSNYNAYLYDSSQNNFSTQDNYSTQDTNRDSEFMSAARQSNVNAAGNNISNIINNSRGNNGNSNNNINASISNDGEDTGNVDDNTNVNTNNYSGSGITGNFENVNIRRGAVPESSYGSSSTASSLMSNGS